MSHVTIPLAGVIGHPIAHSLSPRLHGYWLSELGVSGFYVPLDVADDALPDVLASLPRMGFRGVNVTTPHKEAALVLANRASARAKEIGAANTLTFLADGGFEADNTDAFGFAENLRQEAPDWQPDAGPAVVLGAGGAARAILSALITAGVPEIRLANRTRSRADALSDAFGPAVRVAEWSEAGAILEGARTVVNTTTLGMADGDRDFPVSLEAMSRDCLATDIVYTPLETPFLRAAAARGARTVDGLGMLLHQGIPGFERWFGARPTVTEALRQAVLAP
ncbi:MAG: shikimate dehydrogenase [Pseudomonadota bacterium]